MNLQKWIAADHAQVENRLHNNVLTRVPQELWSAAPPGGGSSIAWLLFHMTYHQDLALNTAVRNQTPLLGDHRADVGLVEFATDVGLQEAENTAATKALQLDALLRYRRAVQERSAAWIASLSVMALDSVPNTHWRLEHKAGISPTDLDWLYAMWNDKPVSWFVQWECVGHGHAHVGEMTGIRSRLAAEPKR